MEVYLQIKKDIGKFILLTLVLFVVLNGVRNLFHIGTDDSDVDSMNRSGLRIHTDALTGVQYVSDGNSLTVRVDSVGNPVTINR